MPQRSNRRYFECMVSELLILSHTLRTSRKRKNIEQLLIAVLGRQNSSILLPSWAEREETTIPENSSLLDNEVHPSSIFPFSQWKVGVLWYCTSNSGCFLPPIKSTDMQHLIYGLGMPRHLIFSRYVWSLKQWVSWQPPYAGIKPWDVTFL